MKKIKNKIFVTCGAICVLAAIGFGLATPVHAQSASSYKTEVSVQPVNKAGVSPDSDPQQDAVDARREAQQDAVTTRQGLIAVDRAVRSDQIQTDQENAYDDYVDRAFERDVVKILNNSLNRAVVDAIQNEDRRYSIEQRNQAYDEQYDRNYERDQKANKDNRDRVQDLLQLQDTREATRLIKRDQAVETFKKKQAADIKKAQDARNANSRTGERQAKIDKRNANGTATMASYDSSEAQTLGDMIVNFGGNMTRLPSLFYIFSYVSGAFLMAMGLLKANKATMNPQQNPVSNAIKYMFAGVAMTVLPATVTILKNSLGLERSTWGIDYSKGLNGGAQQAGEGAEAVEKAAETAAGGLDQFFVTLMRDIGEPMFLVINLFGLVAGVFLIANALQRLTKGAQEGAKGPAGIGTIMNFVVGAALISLVPSMKVFTVSLFGNSNVVTFPDMSTIANQIGTTEASMAQVTAVITSLLGFLAIVGAISFVRGLFMLKDVSDGAQNASFMGSISHLVAGVLCVNFGAFLNVFQNTLNLNEYGILFK